MKIVAGFKVTDATEASVRVTVALPDVRAESVPKAMAWPGAGVPTALPAAVPACFAFLAPEAATWAAVGATRSVEGLTGSTSGFEGVCEKLKSAVRSPSWGRFSRTVGRGSGRPSVAA